MKHKITITFNRTDGSERARFDNFDDAILYAKAIEKEDYEEKEVKRAKTYHKRIRR